MFKSLNRSISTPIAIIIIVVLAVIVGGGILVYQYKFTPKESESTPTPPPKDETADWKTYRNEEYGFEIKYPNDWQIEQDVYSYGTTVTTFGFSPINLNKFPTCAQYLEHYLKDISQDIERAEFWAKQYCMIIIRIERNTNQLSIKDYLNKYYSPPPDYPFSKKINELEVSKIEGDIEATKARYAFMVSGGIGAGLAIGVSDYDQFILKIKSYIIFITNTVYDEVHKPDSTFERVISTFKFLE